jgi:hypothetical protein
MRFMMRSTGTWVCGLLLALTGCGDDSGTPTPGTDAGTVDPPCEYPPSSGMLAQNEIMPPFVWNGALLDDEARTLDLEEFYCSSEYDRYESLVLLVSAGWCSACPEYIRGLDGMSSTLEANGTLIAYLEVETAAFDPATSPAAKEFIDGLIMDGPGYRIGDADNTMPNTVRGLVSQFPSAYFVRRRDMSIVADQAASIYVIDFGALSANPDGAWEPVRPPFMADCTTADEEPGEPNDTRETAMALPADTEIMGGICADGPDWYRVDLEGAWRFDLYLDNFMGDLNLNLYNDAGERIGGSNQRANHDWVDFEGPAWVEVYGQDRASNVYRVSVSPRP